MEPEYDNRNAPTYLAHYGMHRPPFATKTEEDMYYAEPTRNKRLDILLHLTQYGNELLLVTGPEGSGKTTLMHQFLSKAQGNWKVCSLNAHAKLDEEQVVYRICHCFNLSVENGSNITANVKQQLEHLLASPQTVAIVIDNAHVLAPEVLSLLTDLAKIKNRQSGALVRVVLFAEPNIKIQFAAIEQDNKPKYAIRKIDLPPFDEKQTGELIRHRIKTAGLEANSTFTESAIGKIYKQSEGLPGNIIELAHRVLFEMTPLKRRTKPTPVATAAAQKKKNPMVLIGGIIAVLVIAFLLMFQDQINQLYSPKSAGQEEAPQRTTTALAIPELTAEQPVAETMPTENNVQQDDQTAIYATDAEQQTDTTETTGITAGHNKETDSLPAKREENNSAAAPQRDNPVPPMKPRDEPLAVNINQESWLLAQPPNYYTLQLVAGYRKATVNNYLKLHKLAATDLAYYFSLNKGKGWHSLVYGIYPDYSSAKAAIDRLPRAVRKSKPWIRQLKSVQKEITEAAGEPADL